MKPIDNKERITRAIELANCKLILKDLGIEYKEKSGGTAWFKCQTYSHKERDASCKIETSKRSKFKGCWYCFGCHASGTVIDLVRLVTQLRFWESVQYVESRLGNDLVDDGIKPSPFPKLPKEYNRPKHVDNWNVAYLNYLRGRGVTWQQIKKHKIGYCEEGFYKNHIIIPVRMGVHFATWIGRAIAGKARVTSCYGGHVGLFASEFAKPVNGPAIIVEGWADALRLMRLGYKNVMALQTNIVHEEQFEFLKPFPYIIVMPDNDDGGRMLNNSLASYNDMHEIYVAWIKSKDPAVAEDQEIIESIMNMEEWSPKIIRPEVEIVY